MTPSLRVLAGGGLAALVGTGALSVLVAPLALCVAVGVLTRITAFAAAVVLAAQLQAQSSALGVLTFAALVVLLLTGAGRAALWSPEDSLFRVHTNLRYGCTILRYYLDKENGNLFHALARYNGSRGSRTYPAMVDRVWRTRWYQQ